MMRATVKKAGGAEAIGSTTALGQMGSPQDAAGVVLYLSGRAAAGVTGATILVDAGALAYAGRGILGKTSAVQQPAAQSKL